MNPTHKDLAEQVFRLSNKIIFLEKRSILKHGELKLYPSELHLLDVIDRDSGINASEMAARLGVTKGAVSQTLTRLEKKGVLNKTRDPNNKNELTVHFTDLGSDVREQRRKERALLAERFAGCLAEVSDKEKAVIGSFLKDLLIFFDGMR